jgi:hypothetical protein
MVGMNKYYKRQADAYLREDDRDGVMDIQWVDNSVRGRAAMRATYKSIAKRISKPAKAIRTVRFRILDWAREIKAWYGSGQHVARCSDATAERLVKIAREVVTCQPAGGRILPVATMNPVSEAERFQQFDYGITCKNYKLCPWCHYRKTLGLFDQIHSLGDRKVTYQAYYFDITRPGNNDLVQVVSRTLQRTYKTTGWISGRIEQDPFVGGDALTFALRVLHVRSEPIQFKFDDMNDEAVIRWLTAEEFAETKLHRLFPFRGWLFRDKELARVSHHALWRPQTMEVRVTGDPRLLEIPGYRPVAPLALIGSREDGFGWDDINVA